MADSLKKAVREAEQKAKVFPRFWEFWQNKSHKERKEIFKEAVGYEIPVKRSEVYKDEYAHLLLVDEIAAIMDFCEVQ